MASLWKRSTSDKSSKLDAPILAAKTLRNTLSGTFFSKLGAKPSDDPDRPEEFKIKAYQGAAVEALPTVTLTVESAATGSTVQAPSRGAAEPEGQPGHARIVSQLESSEVSADPDDKALSTFNSTAFAPTKEAPHLLQQLRGFETDGRVASERPRRGESYADELLDFLTSTSEQKADTLMKLRSLKVQDQDQSRTLERGISYADEALDSMTSGLLLDKEDGVDSESAGLSKESASEQQNPSSMPAAANIAESSSEPGENIQNTRPFDPERLKALPDMQLPAAPSHLAAWADPESIGGADQDLSLPAHPDLKASSSATLPESQPSSHSSIHTSKHGSSSQPLMGDSLASTSNLAAPRLLQRGISYADEVLGTLASEASLDHAEPEQARTARESLTGQSRHSGVRRSSSKIARSISNTTSELATVPAALADSLEANGSAFSPTPEQATVASDGLPEAAISVDAALSTTSSLQHSQAPSQSAVRVLRRGESYADEVLDGMLAEDDGSNPADVNAPTSWAGLPTIMEGEQIAAQSLGTQDMSVPPGDTWQDSGRPPSRQGPGSVATEPTSPEGTASLPLEEEVSTAALSRRVSRQPSASQPSDWPQAQHSPADAPVGVVQHGKDDPPEAGVISQGAAAADGTAVEILSLPAAEEEVQPTSDPDIRADDVPSMPFPQYQQEQGEDLSSFPWRPAADHMVAPDSTSRSAAAQAIEDERDDSASPPCVTDVSLDSAAVAADAFVQDQPMERSSHHGEGSAQPVVSGDDDPDRDLPVKTAEYFPSQPANATALPGIADAADQNARILHARLSRSLSATGKAAKILHKTASYVRRTASLTTRSIPILPSQRSVPPQQDSHANGLDAGSDAPPVQPPTVQEMDMNPRADVAAAQPKAALPDYADRLDLESDVDVKQFEQSGPCGAHYSQAGIEAAEEEQTRGSKVQASSAKGQKEPLQSSHPTSMQPQSIDDDAMPALQSPAAYSPSAPQPLHQQDSQAVSDLPISIPRPTGSASPTPPRQAEQDRSSASMLPTPESTEKSLFNRLEDQYISIQRFPTGSESPDRLQSRGRNAASQTQVWLLPAEVDDMPTGKHEHIKQYPPKMLD